MENAKNYVGIDISKHFFDVAIYSKGKYEHQQLSNNSEGFSTLIGLLKDKGQCHVVMEASGPYYLNLAVYLHATDVAVSVINPLVIRRFCQMRLSRAKTDKKDAMMIAEYGKSEQPQLWEPEPAHALELRQLQTVVDQLNKNRIGLLQQLEALKQSPVISKDALKVINSAVRGLEKQIETLELKMQAIIQQHYPELYGQLQSIPGLGKKTALLLIVVTGGFKKFSNAKQVSSYFGLSPRIFESGISVRGRSKITKLGMAKIRAMLYICAWSAKKCNATCRQLFDRIVEKGKSKKLALIAVANKLIKQAFAVAEKNTPYRPDYQKNICF